MLRSSGCKLKLHQLKRSHVLLDRRKSSAVPTPSSQITIEFPNRTPLNLSFGKLARFADGSCVATCGSTSVLVTTVCPIQSSSNAQGFVPLTVDYRQKAAAAGRIPTNFLRRELGPSDREILTARVIDRSLRPLFPKGFSSETQIVANLLAVDGVHDPDVAALNAASAALSLSDIPWNGPVGAVRVGCLPNNQLVINPTRKEFSESRLNLMVAGTRSKLTVMLEADAANIDKSLFLEAIHSGLETCSQISEAIHQEAVKNGRPKRPVNKSQQPKQELEDVFQEIKLLCEQPLKAVYTDFSHDKISRDKAAFAVRDRVISHLKPSYPNLDPSAFYEAYSRLGRDIITQMVIEQQLRVDGRQIDELRKIGCQVDLHAPLHGSALFQRGQTQVVCTVALDSLESALKSDAISVLTGGVKEKNFFLHYEFPPYATNEIGRLGSSGRRELGHGALAEKALKSVIPSDYPFTIRLTSEVLESNGSSSMASVCGGSLALMDAGVPITHPAAGVAIGLISRNNTTDGENGFVMGDHAVLVDILGLEDYLGDMDFKLAGTRDGITALQADIKLPGLPFNIVEEAMEKGHEGINRILDIMEQVISEPRTEKANWPVSEKLDVTITKRGKFIGPGGINIKKLLSETGVQVISSTEDAGSFTLFAPNAEAMSEAKEIIDKLLTEERVPELTFGAIYKAKITEILDRGVFVQLHPEMQPVLISNSQLDAKKVHHPSVLGFKEGQEILVKYYGRDPVSGAIRISRKALTVGAASAVRTLRQSTARSQSSNNIEDPQSPESSSEKSLSLRIGGPRRQPEFQPQLRRKYLPIMQKEEAKQEAIENRKLPQEEYSEPANQSILDNEQFESLKERDQWAYPIINGPSNNTSFQSILSQESPPTKQSEVINSNIDIETSGSTVKSDDPDQGNLEVKKVKGRSKNTTSFKSSQGNVQVKKVKTVKKTSKPKIVLREYHITDSMIRSSSRLDDDKIFKEPSKISKSVKACLQALQAKVAEVIPFTEPKEELIETCEDEDPLMSKLNTFSFEDKFQADIKAHLQLKIVHYNKLKAWREANDFGRSVNVDLDKEIISTLAQIQFIKEECSCLSYNVMVLSSHLHFIAKFYKEDCFEDFLLKEAMNNLESLNIQTVNYIKEEVLIDRTSIATQSPGIKRTYHGMLHALDRYELTKSKFAPLNDWLDNERKISKVLTSDDETITDLVFKLTEQPENHSLEIKLFKEVLELKDDLLKRHLLQQGAWKHWIYSPLNEYFKDQIQAWEKLEQEQVKLKQDWQGHHNLRLDQIGKAMDKIYVDLKTNKNFVMFRYHAIRRYTKQTIQLYGASKNDHEFKGLGKGVMNSMYALSKALEAEDHYRVTKIKGNIGRDMDDIETIVQSLRANKLNRNK